MTVSPNPLSVFKNGAVPHTRWGFFSLPHFCPHSSSCPFSSMIYVNDVIPQPESSRILKLGLGMLTHYYRAKSLINYLTPTNNLSHVKAVFSVFINILKFCCSLAPNTYRKITGHRRGGIRIIMCFNQWEHLGAPYFFKVFLSLPSTNKNPAKSN